MWGIRAPAPKPLVLGWIKPLQKHLVKEDRQARTAELSSASLRVEKQMTCYFLNSLPFIDVVNQYPAWYTSVSCNGFRIAALNHTAPYTVRKHLMWSVKIHTVSLCFAANFSSLQIYFVFRSLFGAQQCKVYFAQITQITEKMWSVHVGM